MLYYDDISEDYLDLINKFELLKTTDDNTVGNFLRNNALDLHKRQTVVTRLYFNQDNDDMVGFFSLHNDFVDIEPSIIRENGWNLRTDDQSYYPALKLHFLGVDARYRQQGIGKYLMNEVMYIAKDIALSSGCNFITVEALHSSLKFYIAQGFKVKSRTNDFYNMFFCLEMLDNELLKDTPYIGKRRIQEIKDQIMHFIKQSELTRAEVAVSSGLDEVIIDQIEFGSEIPLDSLERICKVLNIHFP